MAIDPTTETLIPAKETPAAVQKWTRSKKRISHSTLNRWFQTGVAGIVLESILIAGIRYTSQESLILFFNESAKAKSKRHGKVTSEGIRRKRREREAAELGI